MPKVQLTARRHVDAEGKWFKATVSEEVVTVKAEFGTVTVRRTNKGLEVNLRGQAAPDYFYEIQDGEAENPTQVFDTSCFTAWLRPYALVRLGEMHENQPLYKRVAEWMRRGK